jgi:hypothetical protein
MGNTKYEKRRGDIGGSSVEYIATANRWQITTKRPYIKSFSVCLESEILCISFSFALLKNLKGVKSHLDYSKKTKIKQGTIFGNVGRPCFENKVKSFRKSAKTIYL